MEDETNSYKWLNDQHDRLLAWEYFKMSICHLINPDSDQSNGIDDDAICDKVGFNKKYFKYRLLKPAVSKFYKNYEKK